MEVQAAVHYGLQACLCCLVYLWAKLFVRLRPRFRPTMVEQSIHVKWIISSRTYTAIE